jgi:hypothetical protein
MQICFKLQANIIADGGTNIALVAQISVAQILVDASFTQHLLLHWEK